MTLHQTMPKIEPPEPEEEEDDTLRCDACGSTRFEAEEFETWSRVIHINMAEREAFRYSSEYIDDQDNERQWACTNGHYVDDYEYIRQLEEEARNA